MDKRLLRCLLTFLVLAFVGFCLPSCGGGDDDAPNGGGNGGDNGGGGNGGNGTEQVFTGVVTDITASSATVSCNFTSTATAGTLQLGVLFSTERSAVDNQQGTFGMANSSSGNSYTVILSNLLSNTIYYYRAYMISGGKTYYGSVNSFTTSQDELVTTGDATDITYKSATISCRFKTTIIQSFTTLGVEYSVSKETVESGRGSWAKTSSVTNNNEFTISLDGLKEQTTYYYRALVQDYKTTYYGVIKSFTTAAHIFNSNGHEYVDLGLPSGTMWATMNVGASRPEDYGDYYAWGETTTKTSYTEDNYQWKGLFTNELVSRGIVKNSKESGLDSYILTASYDVATLKWGGEWRMPTQTEISELENYTEITTSTQNGVDGFLLTSTENGNSIFLPAGGFRNESNIVNGDGKTWYRTTCWSSELNEYYDNCSIGIWIDNGSSFGMKNIDYTGAKRYYGSPVRPVIK